MRCWSASSRANNEALALSRVSRIDCSSMPMSYSLADATPSAIAEEEPSSTEAPLTAAEPYDVTTFLTTAQFAARPRISTYNYLLGDNVCEVRGILPDS